MSNTNTEYYPAGESEYEGRTDARERSTANSDSSASAGGVTLSMAQFNQLLAGRAGGLVDLPVPSFKGTENVFSFERSFLSYVTFKAIPVESQASLLLACLQGAAAKAADHQPLGIRSDPVALLKWLRGRYSGLGNVDTCRDLFQKSVPQ